MEEFHREARRKDGRNLSCKQCIAEYHAARRREDPEGERAKRTAWKRANREKVNAAARLSQAEVHRRLRAEVIAAYGGACTCCGETEPKFLTVEHVNGLGPADRWPSGKRKSGVTVLRAIKKAGFPSSYSVLCFNCNCAKGHYGVCPHRDPGSNRGLGHTLCA